MASVLSRSPPSYNANNVQGTVRQITDYLRYMHENVDFLLGQLKKKDAETDAVLTRINERLSSIQGELQALEARVTALENA